MRADVAPDGAQRVSLVAQQLRVLPGAEDRARARAVLGARARALVSRLRVHRAPHVPVPAARARGQPGRLALDSQPAPRYSLSQRISHSTRTRCILIGELRAKYWNTDICALGLVPRISCHLDLDYLSRYCLYLFLVRDMFCSYGIMELCTRNLCNSVETLKVHFFYSVFKYYSNLMLK